MLAKRRSTGKKQDGREQKPTDSATGKSKN
jgi:hypothetical protein